MRPLVSRRAPSSRGLGRRPLKAVTPVRIRSGLRALEPPACRKRMRGALRFTPGDDPRTPGAGYRPQGRGVGFLSGRGTILGGPDAGCARKAAAFLSGRGAPAPL